MFRRVYVNDPAQADTDQRSHAQRAEDFAYDLSDEQPDLSYAEGIGPEQGSAFMAEYSGVGAQLGTAMTQVGLPLVIMRLAVLDDQGDPVPDPTNPDEARYATVSFPAGWASAIGRGMIEASTASIASSVVAHIGRQAPEMRFSDPDAVHELRQAVQALTDVGQEEYAKDMIGMGLGRMMEVPSNLLDEVEGLAEMLRQAGAPMPDEMGNQGTPERV